MSRPIPLAWMAGRPRPAIGSFLNVCIYRLPLGLSVVSPPSTCPSCGAAIRWYHNVPVLGWLVLGGKCASCRAPISIRYPIVEAITGAVFVLHYLVIGPDWLLVVRLAFAAPSSSCSRSTSSTRSCRT